MVEIRKKAKCKDLVQTHMYRFLKGLQDSGKLLRCYTQNLDGLEARAKLNTDIKSPGYAVVQLHGDLESLRCTYCGHLTDWDDARESTLISGEEMSCPACVLRVDKRRKNGRRTNIHVGHLRPNIVLNNDDLDPLGKIKASLIDADASSGPDILLIIGTSLAAYGPRSELKSRLILAVYHKGGSVIYVNNKPLPKAFAKPLIDYSIILDCDRWAYEISGPDRPRLDCGFDFQPTAGTIDKVIGRAERELVPVVDYADVLEDLGSFRASLRPSASLLMRILMLFRWDESSVVLHSRQSDIKQNGLEWPVGRKHTRIVIAH